MAMSGKNKIRLTIIKILLIAIPMPIENPTKPRLYSFLMGIKNVLRSNGSERSCRNERLKEEKKAIISRGASKNQNLRKIRGSEK